MKIFLARAALGDVVALDRSRNRATSPASWYEDESNSHLEEPTHSIHALSTFEISPSEPELNSSGRISSFTWKYSTKVSMALSDFRSQFQYRVRNLIIDERGDVPGWVLVVLMTTGLVTGIWTVAAPRIESLLRGSLDSMNNVR